MNEDKVANAKPAEGAASTPATTPSAKPGAGNININLNADSLKQAGRGVMRFVSSYSSLMVFIALMCVYAFLVLQINTYSNPTVTETDVEGSGTPLPTLQIDEAAAQKLQSLQDNSVNVQTLFEAGRTNPF